MDKPVSEPRPKTSVAVEEQAYVTALLRDAGALLEGHFLLSSGLHSDKYFQCARLMQYPDKAERALAALVGRLRGAMRDGKIAVDLVCGPALGGVIVAYEIGRQLGVPAIFTERDANGAMSLRRGFTVNPGDHILITEDVVTTGKSSLESIAVLEALGASVTGIACIVDRRASDAVLELPVYAACTMSVATWTADECALCRTGVPAVKPGSRK
jgi:orotate phosphoribosyltransferase